MTSSVKVPVSSSGKRGRRLGIIAQSSAYTVYDVRRREAIEHCNGIMPAIVLTVTILQPLVHFLNYVIWVPTRKHTLV